MVALAKKLAPPILRDNVATLKLKWRTALAPGQALPPYEEIVLGSLGRLADHLMLVSGESVEPRSVSWAVGADRFCRRSTVTGSSGRQLSRRHEFPSAQKFFQRLAENSVPPFECCQLLRSLAQVREKAGDAGEGGAGARMLAVA